MELMPIITSKKNKKRDGNRNANYENNKLSGTGPLKPTHSQA
jgi:hypothetical protein